jgi:S1-C subfamily serine protease
MDKRVLILVGVLAALLLVCLVGAVVAGGVVFAATQFGNFSRQELVFPQQELLFSQRVDQEQGVVIGSVVSGGPAARAGMARGDILLAINGQAINNPQELVRYLADSEAGDRVELQVLHGDDRRTLTATLDERDGRPYLGVGPCGGLSLEEPLPMPEAITGPGVMVIEVVPESPADEAGLEVGDFILSVDGRELDAESDLAGLMAGYDPGDRVSLEVQSLGQEPREVTATLGEHPEQEGVAYLGVRYGPASHIDLHRFEDLPIPFEERPFRLQPFEEGPLFMFPEGDVEGAVVQRITSDSPAEAAGLKRGDIITAIDGEPVAGPEAVVEAVGEHKPGDSIAFTVYRAEDQDEIELEATLGEHPDKEGEAYLGVQVGAFIRMQNRFENYRQMLPQVEGF